jgi:hypothetical protein
MGGPESSTSRKTSDGTSTKDWMMNHKMGLMGLVFVCACSDYELNGKLDATPEVPDTTTTPRPDPDTGTEVPEDPAFGGVSGKVCDPSGDGYVVGATVYVDYDTDGDGTIDGRAETTTDENGAFTLEGIPEGTWTVVVTKGSFSTTFDVLVTDGEISELAYEECLDGDSATIAVISGNYDSVESILDRLEIEYDLYDGNGYSTQYLDLLKDATRLKDYDIVFFNCGVNDLWLIDQSEIVANLKAFVDGGGSVYASDWAYYFVESSWPDKIEFYGNDQASGSAYVGKSGSLTAAVGDATIEAIVGNDEADLNYDLPSWVVPEGAAAGTNVLLTGEATVQSGERIESPLATRFYEGPGQVIYTTFHNEQQTTLHMDLILEEIILSL